MTGRAARSAPSSGREEGAERAGHRRDLHSHHDQPRAESPVLLDPLPIAHPLRTRRLAETECCWSVGSALWLAYLAVWIDGSDYDALVLTVPWQLLARIPELLHRR